MSTQISTGNIVRYLTGCSCGRAWETDTPLALVPAHTHNHRLDSTPGVHTCAGCLWAVFTHTDDDFPAITADAVAKAFSKHLVTEAQPRTNTPDEVTTKTGPDGTTRTSRKIRVKRSCDGCGESLGDITEAELDAAVAGRPLPSVASEHGCQPSEATA